MAEAVIGAPWMGWLSRLPTWRGCLILAYHRILAEDDEAPFERAIYSATTAGLDAQMRFLSKHFEVVPAEVIASDADRRGRRVVVTFDDGYRDNHEYAFPILREHGIPAAFFLATGFLDRPRVPWWDELAWMVNRSERAAFEPGPWPAERLSLEDPGLASGALARTFKSLPADRTEAFLDHCAEATGAGRIAESEADGLWMSWEMAAELRDAGMDVGGHSANHPVLGRATPEAQAREIDECAQRLAQELGIPMRLFAYPVGLRESFDLSTRTILADAGVELAFSLYGGYLRPGRLDRLDVPRASVGLETNQHAFRAMLGFPSRLARW